MYACRVHVSQGTAHSLLHMDSLTIRPCSVDDIQNAPNIGALMEEYATEAHNPEQHSPDVQWAYYRKLVELGAMQPIAAFVGAELVGFAGVLVNEMPHHGKKLAITESLFVASAHRKGGVGLKLIRAAEEIARNVGAVCLLVSAPHGGALEKVMPRLGYRHSNSTFVRSLA